MCREIAWKRYSSQLITKASGIIRFSFIRNRSNRFGSLPCTDLGNPPFGHSGEKAIGTYFSEGKGLALKPLLSEAEWEDLTHFEGNANAFRLLTHQFEGRRPGGFVMTYSTLASIVKYPFSSRLAGKKQKFGFFLSEEEDYKRIAEELGIIKLSKDGEPIRYARHPLVYLVEAADDICYQMMDIEDAHKIKNF